MGAPFFEIDLTITVVSDLRGVKFFRKRIFLLMGRIKTLPNLPRQTH